MDLILRDAAMYPRLFWWTTPLSILAIEDWEREHALFFPSDLKDLWSSKEAPTFSMRKRSFNLSALKRSTT